jgi:thiamine-phosphate pyrophosphorylase
MKGIRKGLYLILTDPPKGYERMTKMAVAEGLPVVQLRYKGDDVREFLALAHAMREITRGTGTKLIINDRVDIALMSCADGVHLGQNDVSPKEARAVMGEAMVIGLSTHNLDQVDKAQSEPVDYIGFGPVYKPFSKDDYDPVTGVEILRAAVSKSRLPVTAIGGINRERLDEIAAIPCHNFACIGAIGSAEDPSAEMRAIQTKLWKSVTISSTSRRGFPGLTG